MKVYRCLPYIDSSTIINQDLQMLGINYEASNLYLGFCSPSAEFLRYEKNPRNKLNSFAGNGLAKYFYLSLYDAINWGHNRLVSLKGHGIHANIVIWEVDLPDEIVKKYLGVGIYQETTKIESKIPYHTLMNYLALNINNDQINLVADYFKKHYSWKDASQEKEKLNFDLGFEKVSNPDIILSKKDEVYKSLCFPIFMSYGLLMDVNYLEWINEAYKVAFNNKLDNRKKMNRDIATAYNDWYKKDIKGLREFLYEEALILKEENNQIKRALTNDNLEFHKR